MTDLDAAFARVFELAERGRYSTSPNPRVGAVVVASGGEVVGEGWHERAGGPHAEIVALAEAGSRARGATVVLNLEPCAHHGRTPPCADALVEAGVARVVFSILDPDPRTAGKGRERLRSSGIATETGGDVERAERLNETFLVSVRKGRPFIHLKWAATLDGRIGTVTGESRWISGEEARGDAMRLREECDAILVGAGTVLADDPALTRRKGLNRSILPHRRIVVDGRLRVGADRKVFSPDAAGEAWLVTSVAETDPKLAPFLERGVRVLSLPSGNPGRIDLAALLRELARLEVRSLLVEGGGETSWGFIEARLADRLTGYHAPLLLGGRDAPGALSGAGYAKLSEAARLTGLELVPLGDGFRVTGRLAWPGAA
jgi:diaminohydroxyphosphoribosylaminopyrimidine deaminase/5-amino-6-(5-phosphoribosylamino)uracil reductase